MLRGVIRWLLVALAVVVACGIAPGASSAQDPEPPPEPSPTTVVPVPPPTASIVVDGETGEVISEANAREPLPPASTTKILTALLVREYLDLDTEIGIPGTAAFAPPRRLRLQAGTSWGVRDLVYAMMLCSCNDAAWALGQAAGGGTMTGFAGRAEELARRLGLSDTPLLRDPAGLDGETSIDGGNLLSARDLAIAARAYLADPELAEIARDPGHEWVGGDGLPHSVRNLNEFLVTYPGAIGLKTGFTSRAGMTFVGAAERDGRTLVAVVLGSEAHYTHATELLDAGFLLAAAGETTGDVLPAVDGEAPSTTTTTTTSTAPEPASSASDPATGPTTVAPDPDEVAAPPLRRTGSDDDDLPVDPVWLGVGGAVVVVLALAVALLARSRATRNTIDRRPARPRRRDRRRAGT